MENLRVVQTRAGFVDKAGWYFFFLNPVLFFWYGKFYIYENYICVIYVHIMYINCWYNINLRFVKIPLHLGFFINSIYARIIIIMNI